MTPFTFMIGIRKLTVTVYFNVKLLCEKEVVDLSNFRGFV